MDVDVRFGSGGSGRPAGQSPFRMLVIGDFSGRASRGQCDSLAARRCLPVDCDNLDRRMAELGVALRLAAEGAAQDLTFEETDDWHPDSLYDRVPVFERLRDLRARLQKDATFAAAAAELRAMAGSAPSAPEAVAPEAAAGAAAGEGDPLAQLLARPVAGHGGPRNVASGNAQVNALIRKLVAPHIVNAPDPNRDALVRAADAAISLQMREILHAPAFQSVEAAWRGLDFLVRNVETDETLGVYLLDASREELARDLESADEAAGGLYRLLVKETRGTPGGQPWTVIVGLYAFDSAAERDTALLARIGRMAARAGAPFLGALAYAHGGPHAPVPAWEELRRSPGADFLALAAPRVVLRLPYGPGTDPIDRFAFDELPGVPAHAGYLWGSAALICACLMAEAFVEDGWPPAVGRIDQIEGLPLHVYKHEGESRMTPCAEFWLSDSDAETLVAEGIIPLLSVKGRDAVQVARFQALSGKSLPLGG